MVAFKIEFSMPPNDRYQPGIYSYYGTHAINGQSWMNELMAHVQKKDVSMFGVPNALWVFLKNTPIERVMYFSTLFDSHDENESKQFIINHIRAELVSNGLSGKCVNVDELYREIRRKRSALTVNAALYYDLNTNAVSDSQWDKMALELVALQETYPEILPLMNFYDSSFNDFRGETGMHLPYRDPFFQGLARRIATRLKS